MTHGVIVYSTAVLAVIAAGLALRRRRRAHIPLMLSAFALDLASVVYLQIRRGAVQTTVARPTPLLVVHVSFAAASIALYVFLVATGWRLAATGRGRRTHRAGAVLFLVCRLGTWATSFFAAG